jgi:hypothetical protein
VIAGTYSYTPPAGTVLPAGLGQSLSVTFTPTDTTDYTTATGSTTINILQATTAITTADTTIIIGTPNTTLGGQISTNSPLLPAGQPVVITISSGSSTLATQSATIQSDGSFSSTFATASLPAGSYTVTYSYSGDTNFMPVTATSTLNVTYNVNPQFDQGKAHQSGSTIPIKLQLTDAAGNNVGSSDTPITALYVLDQNGNQVPLMDSGNSNPGDLFRFDGSMYIFNLKTTGYASGRYTLYFKVGNDPILHTVSFLIR